MARPTVRLRVPSASVAVTLPESDSTVSVDAGSGSFPEYRKNAIKTAPVSSIVQANERIGKVRCHGDLRMSTAHTGQSIDHGVKGQPNTKVATRNQL